MDDALVRQVEAELRVTWGTSNHTAEASTPPPPATIEGIAVAPKPPVVVTQDLFVTLMKGVTTGYASGAITQDMITAAIKPLGIPSLPSLVLRQELIPIVANTLGIAL